MIDITHALTSLRPGASWTLVGTDYIGLDWHDEEQSKPTQQEIEDEIVRLTNLIGHQSLREQNYPSIKDQLDMLWHAIDNGTLNKTSEFYTAIKAVKDAYPKSE